jgi:hypothetical protein
MKIAPFTLLALCLTLGQAHATDFLSVGHYRLAPEATLTNELWMKATTVDMAGTVEDDLFILTDGTTETATNNTPAMLLSGAMKSDLWAAGESIRVSGPVAQHARLLGFKSVSIAGPVGRNLIALGSTVLVEESAAISGEALLAGRDVLVHGTIGGHTRIYGTQVTLSGHFDQDLTITATDINVMPGTHIGGNLYYMMDRDLLLDSNVTLGGRMIKMEPRAVPRSSGISLGTVWLQVGFYCGALLAGMAFIGLFPGIAAMSIHHLSTSPWRCLLIGFVTFCLVPMVSFFLLFTVVGLPLCLITMLAYIIVVYLGKMVSGIYVGHWLLRRSRRPAPLPLMPVLSLGLLVLYAGGCLPFPIDIGLWFAFTLLGMGGLISSVLDRRTPVMVAVPQDPPVAPPPLP